MDPGTIFAIWISGVCAGLAMACGVAWAIDRRKSVTPQVIEQASMPAAAVVTTATKVKARPRPVLAAVIVGFEAAKNAGTN